MRIRFRGELLLHHDVHDHDDDGDHDDNDENQVRPSMRKLRQGMDSLLKTSRLMCSVLRLQQVVDDVFDDDDDDNIDHIIMIIMLIMMMMMMTMFELFQQMGSRGAGYRKTIFEE